LTTGTGSTGATSTLSAGSRSTGAASTWAWQLQGAIFHGFDGGSLFRFIEGAILVRVVRREGFVELRGSGSDHFAGWLAFRSTFRGAFLSAGWAAGTASGRSHFEGTVIDGRGDFFEFSGFQFAILVGVEGGEGSVACAELGDGFGGWWALRTAAAGSTGSTAAGSFRSLGLGRGHGQTSEGQRENELCFHGLVFSVSG
jgi:hypothetical protein